MKRLDSTEIIFKILSYVLVTLFALATLYPLIFTLSAAISSQDAMVGGSVVLLPIGLQFEAVGQFFVNENFVSLFWNAYTNTLFFTFYGTLFSMIITIGAAYALSKTNLLFKRQINFYIVFTMWFSAGLIPNLLNLQMLGVDNRWGIIYAFGVAAFNIILLRNYFVGISREIEEAAIVDGANEFQVLTNIYIPMSKSAIATVTLFYALGRWNGFFWNMRLVGPTEHPMQVVLRLIVQMTTGEEAQIDPTANFHLISVSYAAIVLSIIPILAVYPLLQKYMSAGVNTGGVKE